MPGNINQVQWTEIPNIYQKCSFETLQVQTSAYQPDGSRCTMFIDIFWMVYRMGRPYNRFRSLLRFVTLKIFENENNNKLALERQKNDEDIALQ